MTKATASRRTTAACSKSFWMPAITATWASSTKGKSSASPMAFARRRGCWRKCAMSLVVHDICSAQDEWFGTVLPNAATSTNPHLKKHKNMKNSPASNLSIVGLACALLVATNAPTSAQNLTNGLVAYWPLDQVQGDKTPDLVNGY